MSAERVSREEPDNSSLLDVGIKHALKGIADIKALAEEKGTPEKAVADLYSSALSKELKEVRREAISDQIPEPTFGQKNRVLTRRRTRNNGIRLLNRR